MKKQIGAALIIILVSGLSFAQSSVEQIPTKDSQFENTVTIEEFNSLVKTLRGFYNFFTEDTLRIGINEPQPASNLTLDVGGKVGATEYCDENGEHCINPATWDARPQLELNPPGAECVVRYRVRDAKYESDWAETGLGNDPGGAITYFNSGLQHNCQGRGCGIQMALKCTPEPAITESASCRLRYRTNHLKQSSLTPWITTQTTFDDTWQEGDWAQVVTEDGSWGDGLNFQVGMECNEPAIRCQVSYRLHNEVETTDWQSTPLTQGDNWQDGPNAQTHADTLRACDQRVGCGLQIKSHCVGTTSTLKTPLYSCPNVKDDRCPSQCTGQLSLEDKCSYQQLGQDDNCTLLLTENCERVGHLVQ